MANKEKKRKPLLLIGIILALVALFVGIGFFLTGSIVFARNAFATLIAASTFAGLGYGAFKLSGIFGSNKEKTKEYNRQYYLKRKDELIKAKKEYQKEYSKTQMGRAQRQYQQYKFMDKRNGFDEVIDFNAKWIVDNIYTKPCAHCGESDWHKLGCNRLDNSKPHTIDNVEPCCFHCNCVLNGIETQAKKGRH